MKFVNRAKMSTATTGTGTITLGSATLGYQSFASAGIVDGDTVRYVLEEGVAWEIGTGVYDSSTGTMTRVLVQSSTGNLLDLTGSAVVFLTAAGQDLLPTQGGTMTGNLTVPSINNGPLAGFRNAIINGGMEIAQRGTSGTSGYLIDRWIAINTSAQSQSSDVPDGFLNSLEFTSDVATTPLILQRIERINSYHLAGQTCTISFWAKNVSGSSFLAVQIFRAGANDNFSSITEEHSVILSMSPSTSWVKYAATFTLSSAATTGLQIIILRNDDSAASTRVTGVQLEAGPVATPFERRPIGTELALCQRYFCVFGVTAGSAYPSGGAGALTFASFYFPQPMRVGPTLTVGTATVAVNLASDFFSPFGGPSTTSGVYAVEQGAAAGNYYGFRTGNLASAEL